MLRLWGSRQAWTHVGILLPAKSETIEIRFVHRAIRSSSPQEIGRLSGQYWCDGSESGLVRLSMR